LYKCETVHFGRTKCNTNAMLSCGWVTAHVQMHENSEGVKHLVSRLKIAFRISFQQVFIRFSQEYCVADLLRCIPFITHSLTFVISSSCTMVNYLLCSDGSPDAEKAFAHVVVKPILCPFLNRLWSDMQFFQKMLRPEDSLWIFTSYASPNEYLMDVFQMSTVCSRLGCTHYI
jgi:hypothetical protein